VYQGYYITRDLTDIRRDHFDFLNGHVNYGHEVNLASGSDMSDAPVIMNRLAPFQKQQVFHLDSEYRFLAQLRTTDSRMYTAVSDLNPAECDAVTSTSPLCPDWLAQCVEDVTRAYYPKVVVKKLELD